MAPLVLLLLVGGAALVAGARAKGKAKGKLSQRRRRLGVVGSGDFPHPYAYEDVLKVALKLVPSNLDTSPGTEALDVDLLHGEDGLYGQLKANTARVVASKAPPWLKSVALFHSVIWPFFAAGLGGGRWFQKGRPAPGSVADKRVREFAAFALWSVMWMIDPVMSVVPKNRSLADALTELGGPTAFEVLDYRNFKKPTVEEQTQALFDLTWYLRRYGSVLNPALGQRSNGSNWHADQEGEGGQRIRAIQDQYFHGPDGDGFASSSREQVEGNMRLIQEAVRSSLEIAVLESLQVERDVLDWQSDRLEAERTAGLVVTIVATVIVVAVVAYAVAPAVGGVVAAVSATVETGAAVVTSAVTSVAAAVLGPTIGAWAAGAAVLAGEAAILGALYKGLEALGNEVLSYFEEELGFEIDEETKAQIAGLVKTTGGSLAARTR